jgi:hypothetical protein
MEANSMVLNAPLHSEDLANSLHGLTAGRNPKTEPKDKTEPKEKTERP